MDKQHFAIDRKNDRISTDLPCRFALPSGEPFEATLLNLSTGGLKLACNRAAYEAIIPPDQITPGQVSDVSINVMFSLPQEGRRAVDLDLAASLIHTERLAQDRFHIGVQFTGLARDDLARLETYIETARSSGNSSGF